jgi:uncharacterized protein (DUF488 family)
MPEAGAVLYTVGHSNHPFEVLRGLLARHGVDAVADVRSTPFSRRNPQYNRAALAAALEAHGIAYVFLGAELGARSADPAHYREGRVDFERLGASVPFQAGLTRLLAGARTRRIALLCAEKEPLDCHRTLLVSRRLVERGARVAHILADGGLEPHADTEARLLALTKSTPPPLLAGPTERAAALERAYAIRGRAIAYSRPPQRRTPQPRHR